MGKFIEKFKHLAEGIDNKANNYVQKKSEKPKNFNSHLTDKRNEKISEDIYSGIDEDFEDFDNQDFNRFNDFDDFSVGIQPAQKPESFHHFILENQYKDLEKSIRGYKDVFNKETGEWDTKRKKVHCFTDEEAEEILRTAQSHLATDIKLSFINKEVFNETNFSRQLYND